MSTKAAVLFLIGGAGILETALGQPPQGSVKITLDQALQMAVQHNQALLAARTTVQQSIAQEVTANLRPNPQFTAIWAYLPLYRTEEGFFSYLHDQTEFDAGLSYLKERGQKRQLRLQAAKDGTAVTRSQVEDNERTLKFQVASQFINVQLAESVLDLARQNVASYQRTVDLGETQFKGGAISENDFLKIKLQLVQYQTDLQQSQLSRVQALSDLRQLLGYETVPADYSIAGTFDYRPLVVTFEELQAKALQNRPDLHAAQQGVSAANSQYALAKANGKQDVTLEGNYSHSSGFNTFSVSMSIPLAIFDRNQGEIARTNYAISQARYGLRGANGQVITDVRDAYEGLQTSDRVVNLYRSGTSKSRGKTATSASMPISGGRPACSTFWTPSAPFARLNSPTARRWLPIFSRSSRFTRPSEPRACRDQRKRSRLHRESLLCPAIRVSSEGHPRLPDQAIHSFIPNAFFQAVAIFSHRRFQLFSIDYKRVPI